MHETAHGITVNGFQSDLRENDDSIVKQNNKLVDKYCRKLIERK